MKFEKVIFYELFPTSSFANQRLGVEVALDDGDSPLVAFERARDMVREAFNKLNPPLPIEVNGILYTENPDWQAKSTPLTGTQTAPPIRNLAAERTEIAIENAKTFEELDKLYDDCNKYGLMPEYHKKLNSLPNDK